MEDKTHEILDIASEQFDPIRFLYDDNLRVCAAAPKVQYQNLAAFESALKSFGVWELNKRKKQKDSKEKLECTEAATTTAKTTNNPFEMSDGNQQRRFLPHQLPIRKDPQNKTPKRHLRNLFNLMDNAVGPLALLKKCVMDELRCRVYVRNQQGVRGTISGQLICFDKYMNLMLIDVVEQYHRRKYKYGENKICGTPVDCTDRLRDLGITLPKQVVKSLNRKNCEITRNLKQLFLRGEQVVAVAIISNEKL